MKSNDWSAQFVESITYLLIATAALVTVYLLCYLSPVVYVRLITEDQWGEYGTAVCFGVAGILLVFLAMKPGPFSRRLFWALAGICAFLIAAEEISWGQRIFKRLFNVSIFPDALLQLNAQGEANFHNIGALDSLNRDGLHRAAGWLLLGWTILSAAIAILARDLSDKIEKIGLPLIAIRLLPFFLLVPYFFLMAPLPRWSEIGELFLAFAVLAWAVDLLIRFGFDKLQSAWKKVNVIFGIYISCVILTAALTWVFPGGLEMRLNRMAAITYPSHNMYDQAEQLYTYIYANPQYLTPDTRINNARMHFKLEQNEKGQRLLREALSDIDDSQIAQGELLRRKGIIYSLLGDKALAARNFSEAIAVDKQLFELAKDPEEKAQLMFSVAETFEAMGDLTMALKMARTARDSAVSARLSGRLDRWILDLNQRLSDISADDSI